jgi:hypothetical protein
LLLFFVPAFASKEKDIAFLLILFFVLATILRGRIGIFYRVYTMFAFAFFPMVHLINVYNKKWRKIILLIFFCWTILTLYLLVFRDDGGSNLLTVKYTSIFKK